MKKLLLTGIILCSAIILIGAQAGYAYQNFNQGCITCHPTTAGTGLHIISAHTNCASCHPGGVPGKNVESSACIVCHPRGNTGLCPLIDLPAHASQKQTCLGCHTTCAPITTTTTIPEQPILDLGSAAAEPCSQVDIPITLTNNGITPIAGIGMDIGYDSTYLTPVNATIGPAGQVAGKEVIKSFVSPGLFRIGVFSLSNMNVIGNGVVAYVTFALNCDAPESIYQLTNTPSAATPEGVDVPIDGSDGSIKVCVGCFTTTTVPPTTTNDDFDNATAITALPFQETINTSGATSAADDPTDCYGADASVWYKLTSVTDIKLRVVAVSADYNTVLAAYTGTRGNLNLVACRDYAPCFDLDVRAGETYYFMVTSLYGGGGNMVINVDVAPPPPPPLTIDLKVDPIDFVNNGITTVSGTVNSSVPANGHFAVQVRQKAGRVFITGYNYIYFNTTDGVARWTMEVPGDIGPFLPGKATVSITEGYGCSYYDLCSGYSECTQIPEVSTTVHLRNEKK